MKADWRRNSKQNQKVYIYYINLNKHFSYLSMKIICVQIHSQGAVLNNAPSILVEMYKTKKRHIMIPGNEDEAVKKNE